MRQELHGKLKHSYAMAAVVTTLALGALTLTGNGQKEKTGQVQQPLVNGQVVSPVFQETYGLLSLGNCSATLLTNDWAITAAHCFSPANIANPSTVTVTANWTKPARRRGAQIVTFGTPPNWAPWDIALIRMDFRFILANSPDDFRQSLWGDGPNDDGNLTNTRIEILGRGINRFATGSGASAVPSQSDGQYRYGTALVTRFDEQRYWYTGDNGVMIAGGDSGGASFAKNFRGRAITGVHALCTTQCLPGQMCTGNSWTWVAATPECGDAPVWPIRNQITQTIEANRSPAPPLGPDNPIGTFEDYKPCNPVVFIPAPDAPANRISQGWGDRGFWDQDRINVRIQESPKGSGLFDVVVREGNPPNAVETSMQQVRISERPTFQYNGPIYALSPTSLPGSGKINAGNLGAAAPGRPAPSREPGATSNPGGAAQQGGIAKSGIGIAGADRVKVPYRFDRSLGLSLDKGIRLEVDIQCDERLAPRIYQVRYLRLGGSGESVVDVMLKFSQPPAR